MAEPKLIDTIEENSVTFPAFSNLSDAQWDGLLAEVNAALDADAEGIHEFLSVREVR